MDTLIGPVPDDWASAPLHTICDIQAGPSGASIRLADRVADGVPLVTPKNLAHGRITGQDVGHVPPATADRLARYRLRVNDVLCSRTGELGLCARVATGQEGWLFATALLRLRPGAVVDPGYLVHYLRLSEVRDWIERRVTGTAVPTISAHAFGALPVVLPPIAIQQAVSDVLGTLDEKVSVHERISRDTVRLRDGLAPLLMTGAMSAAFDGTSQQSEHTEVSHQPAGSGFPSA